MNHRAKGTIGSNRALIRAPSCLLARQPPPVPVQVAVVWRAVEDWVFVDEHDLESWKGGVVRMTCQHFTYGVDDHCHTVVGCKLRQKRLGQGDQLKNAAKYGRRPCSKRSVGLQKLVNPSTGASWPAATLVKEPSTSYIF